MGGKLSRSVYKTDSQQRDLTTWEGKKNEWSMCGEYSTPAHTFATKMKHAIKTTLPPPTPPHHPPSSVFDVI